MSTIEGQLLPTLLAGDELEAVTLNETDRRAEHDTYVPTLTASGGTPAIGADGFLTGWWYRTGRLMTVWIDLNLSGAGVSLVGTSWRISLPYAADVTRHSVGVLDAASDAIGNARTRSGTSGQSTNFGVLISAASEIIMYAPATNTSMGSADFTTSARIKAVVQYMVATSAF